MWVLAEDGGKFWFIGDDDEIHPDIIIVVPACLLASSPHRVSSYIWHLSILLGQEPIVSSGIVEKGWRRYGGGCEYWNSMSSWEFAFFLGWKILVLIILEPFIYHQWIRKFCKSNKLIWWIFSLKNNILILPENICKMRVILCIGGFINKNCEKSFVWLYEKIF